MRKIVIAVTLVFACTVFASCTNQKSTEVVAINNGRMLTKTDSEVKEISGGDYVSKQVRKENYYNENMLILEDRVINSSKDGGLDVIYSDNKRDYIEPQNKGFYIVDYITNGDYLVWVEADVKKIDRNAKKLKKEFIYSRSIKTGEFVEIASLDYSDLENDEVGISEFNISENNNLVYKYHEKYDGEKINEKVVLYNLDNNASKEIISNIDENIRIENLRVGKSNVVYTENKYDSNGNFIGQKVFNHIIKKSKTEEIDLGLEVKNLDIYDREIVFISENQNTNLELYIYNLDNSQLISRVFEDSNLSNYYKKTGLQLDYNKGTLDIDDSYIYLLGQSSVVYDLENKKFIVLENNMNANVNNYDSIHSKKVGDKKVIISHCKGEESLITEYTLK